MQVLKKIASVALILMLMFSLSVSAFAEQSEYADKPGNLIMHINDSVDVSMGGKLEIYKAADAKIENGVRVFTPTSDFPGADCAITKNADLTAELLSKMASGAKPLKTADINKTSRTAVFSALEPGLYLVKSSTDSYVMVNPFAIDMPHGTSTGWEYNVELKDVKAVALPKIDPPIKKVVKNGKDTDTFSFMMEAVNGGPMPDPSKFKEVNAPEVTATATASGSKMVVTGVKASEAGGIIEFGWIYYTEADVGNTYTYKVTELDVPSGYTCDKTNGYTVTVKVHKDSDGNVVADKTCSDGVNASDWHTGSTANPMIFTNTRKAGPTPTPTPKPPIGPSGPLPQTGMLWWPVAVLGIAGLLFIIIGVRMRTKKEEN